MDFLKEFIKQTQTGSLKTKDYTISFENVSFSYPDGTEAHVHKFRLNQFRLDNNTKPAEHVQQLHK